MQREPNNGAKSPNSTELIRGAGCAPAQDSFTPGALHQSQLGVKDLYYDPARP